MHRSILTRLCIVLALAGAAVSGCSSDTVDKAEETAGSAKDDAATAIDDASARARAEALRASLKLNGTADDEGVRSVLAIQQAADDLPGDSAVSGIEDGDDDGLDDDGRVQVTVDGSSVCLVLPASGEDIQVTDGEC